MANLPQKINNLDKINAEKKNKYKNMRLDLPIQII